MAERISMHLSVSLPSLCIFVAVEDNDLVRDRCMGNLLRRGKNGGKSSSPLQVPPNEM